jgi:hypothetical protein
MSDRYGPLLTLTSYRSCTSQTTGLSTASYVRNGTVTRGHWVCGIHRYAESAGPRRASSLLFD